jgi:hypothetical protein
MGAKLGADPALLTNPRPIVGIKGYITDNASLCTLAASDAVFRVIGNSPAWSWLNRTRRAKCGAPRLVASVTNIGDEFALEPTPCANLDIAVLRGIILIDVARTGKHAAIASNTAVHPWRS